MDYCDRFYDDLNLKSQFCRHICWCPIPYFLYSESIQQNFQNIIRQLRKHNELYTISTDIIIYAWNVNLCLTMSSEAQSSICIILWQGKHPITSDEVQCSLGHH